MPKRQQPLVLTLGLALTGLATVLTVAFLTTFLPRTGWPETTTGPILILATATVFMLGLALAWVKAGYEIEWPDEWPFPKRTEGGGRRSVASMASAAVLIAAVIAAKYTVLPALLDLAWEWLKHRFGH